MKNQRRDTETSRPGGGRKQVPADLIRFEIDETDVLREEDVWGAPGQMIWRANRFTGRPGFYPVYQRDDHYSYSLLALIRHKGALRLNPDSRRKIDRRNFTYFSGDDTIDAEIRRIGGPRPSTRGIRDPEELVQRLAIALRNDIGKIEARLPNHMNVILVGGRDSLNLLLLPWRNPVRVLSAPPNYDLVVRFVDENGLGFKVDPLDDEDASLLETEVLVNACRNNLEHCRWGPDLRRVSLEHERRVIFWKGQLGVFFRAPDWERYTHPTLARKMLIRIHSRSPRNPITRSLVARNFYWSTWYRGAMWQGVHNGIIRELTGALVLSGYHGPEVARVLWDIDLGRAVRSDIRPRIGELLHGAPVRYPKSNPGPPVSRIRAGLSGIGKFVNACRDMGIPVQSSDPT